MISTNLAIFIKHNNCLEKLRGKFILAALFLWAFTCSKSKVETPEQGMKSVQS